MPKPEPNPTARCYNLKEFKIRSKANCGATNATFVRVARSLGLAQSQSICVDLPGAKAKGKPFPKPNEVNMEHARVGLQKIVADSLRRAPAEEAAVLAWPLVCGTAVADKTQAIDINDGILRVQVPDAAWRAQLLGLAPQYLAAVNQFSSHNVRRINFVLPEEMRPRAQS